MFLWRLLIKKCSIIAAICFVFALQSCDDKDYFNDLNEKNNLNVEQIDTLTIQAKTVKEDSVRTDKTLHNLVGFLNDPIMGNFYASFVAQPMLPFSNVVFPENLVVDSLVLSLAYEGYYGKLENNFIFKVWEVADNLKSDVPYYSNTNVGKGILLAEALKTINIKDSVYVDGKKVAPHLRIKLNTNFANEIIQAARNGLLANNEVFNNFFKGIFVESVKQGTSSGTVFYFNLLNPQSKITLYYHTNEGNSSFNLIFNERSVRFNLYKHDFTNASEKLLAQLNGNFDVSYDQLFLKAAGGTKVIFKFPYLKSFAQNQNIVVNRAELILPLFDDNTVSSFPIPSKVVLVQVKSDGNLVFLPEYGTATFGGNYEASQKAYVFNISSYVQQIINGKISDDGVALFVSGTATRSDRVVLNGTAANIKPTLKITYTKTN